MSEEKKAGAGGSGTDAGREKVERLALDAAVPVAAMMVDNAAKANRLEEKADVEAVLRLSAEVIRLSTAGHKAGSEYREAASTLDAMIPLYRQTMRRRKAFRWKDLQADDCSRFSALFAELWNKAYQKRNDLSLTTASPISQATYSIVGAGDRLGDMSSVKVIEPEMMEKAKYPGMKIIQFKTSSSETRIRMPDFSSASKGQNRGVKKLLVYTFTKIVDQAFSDGTLYKDYVTYSLQEIVDAGLYSSKASARQGFKDFMVYRSNLNIQSATWSTGKGKKSTRRFTAASDESLFVKMEIENSLCYVYISPYAPWQAICSYYMWLPNYYYRLSSKAADLLEYCCYLARQHHREIQSTGYFTISYGAVREAMHLPGIEETDHPGRKIIDEIENSVVEIENTQSRHCSEPVLRFELDADQEAPPAEQLETGKLVVRVYGALKDQYISIESKEKKQLIEATRKADKAKEKAKVKKEAEKEKASQEDQENRKK